MAKVTLSKEAQRDIIAIRNYIRDELCNPSAAKHIIACLKKSIQSLEKFSGRDQGRPSPFRERRPIILPLISPPSSAESAHSPHCADQRAMRWWR